MLADSISIGYGPFLKLALQGVFAYGRKNEDADPSDNSVSGQNGGSSSDVLEYMQQRAPEKPAAESWLLLNAGLWDVRRDPETGAIATPIAEYRANLARTFELARAKHFRHVWWVRTTPVHDETHATRTNDVPSGAARAWGFTRKMSDVELYNDCADEVAREHDVRIIDLAPASDALGAAAYKDHVHFTAAVSGQQAGSSASGRWASWRLGTCRTFTDGSR